jgi:hypothetical protein
VAVSLTISSAVAEGLFLVIFLPDCVFFVKVGGFVEERGIRMGEQLG